jgi:RNA polymerase sigma-70 factor (ECF subfamily)
VEKQSDLLRRFLEAVESGDTEGLLALLSQDVVLHSDGGGKGIAVPNAIRGSGNVARGILGSFKRLVPTTLVRRLVRVNGEAGLVNYLDGKPHSVLTVAIADGHIQTIYIVTNPEKLSHLPDLSENPN